MNDGTRTLFESMLSPDLSTALKDWNKSEHGGILIGGAAVSYWGIPRMTHDIDIIFLSDNDIPVFVDGFKRVRPHCYLHLATHVEIEVLTPEFLKIPHEWFDKIKHDSVISNEIKVAGKSSLIALKIQRASYQDKHDIQQLLDMGNIDLTPYHLSVAQLEMVDEIKQHTKHKPVGE